MVKREREKKVIYRLLSSTVVMNPSIMRYSNSIYCMCFERSQHNSKAKQSFVFAGNCIFEDSLCAWVPVCVLCLCICLLACRSTCMRLAEIPRAQQQQQKRKMHRNSEQIASNIWMPREQYELLRKFFVPRHRWQQWYFVEIKIKPFHPCTERKYSSARHYTLLYSKLQTFCGIRLRYAHSIKSIYKVLLLPRSTPKHTGCFTLKRVTLSTRNTHKFCVNWHATHTYPQIEFLIRKSASEAVQMQKRWICLLLTTFYVWNSQQYKQN